MHKNIFKGYRIIEREEWLMGYVLPIDTYQYQNYQNRLTQPERDPYPIERIYPTQLDMSHQKMSDKSDTDMNEWSSNKNQSLTIIKPIMNSESDEIYAEMTGIGQNINEMI